mmetsp:Transcript_36895/g.72553  ORF Transcript_36895/g.72553 Transcript_36895/m.72553 type:complete len:115 (+) Transcript_36895:480-824(+)
MARRKTVGDTREKKICGSFLSRSLCPLARLCRYRNGSGPRVGLCPQCSQLKEAGSAPCEVSLPAGREEGRAEGAQKAGRGEEGPDASGKEKALQCVMGNTSDLSSPRCNLEVSF